MVPISYRLTDIPTYFLPLIHHVKQLSSSAWSVQSMVPSQSCASVMQRPSTQRSSPLGQGDACALMEPGRWAIGKSSLSMLVMLVSVESTAASWSSMAWVFYNWNGILNIMPVNYILKLVFASVQVPITNLPLILVINFKTKFEQIFSMGKD